MHDAVDGGSRVFGRDGDRLTRGSCRCITTSCTKSCFYALMLSTAAPEHSSATISRRFRGSCRCITTSCADPHACVNYAYVLSYASPQAFGCIAVPTGLEATIVCLTMSLREADDYAYNALMQECWKFFGETFALLIFLRIVYIFDWLNSLIAG